LFSQVVSSLPSYHSKALEAGLGMAMEKTQPRRLSSLVFFLANKHHFSRKSSDRRLATFWLKIPD